MKPLYLYAILFLFLVSCNNAKEVKPIYLVGSDKLESYELLVANEGFFGNGVGTLSKINWTDTSSMQAEQNAFYVKNNEYLGNVIQSIKLIDEELWVVVNNSQKIVVCDKELNKLYEIKGLNSPRYITDIQDYVYISDLYQKQLYVWDKRTEKIVKKITTNSWNEEIIAYKNKIFVPQTNFKELLVIDHVSLQITDTLVLRQEPFALSITFDEQLIALCNGGLDQQDKPFIFWINPNTNIKTDSLDLSNLEGIPSRMKVIENRIFILSKHLYEIENHAAKKVIDGAEYNFYGLGGNIDYLFLSDAKDYSSNGTLYRYKLSNMSKLDSIDVGLIPGYIWVK